jgi:hypothetical protein
MVMPRANQPMLDLFDWATGTGPEAFLTPAERAAYADVLKGARLRQSQATRLATFEQHSRVGKGMGFPTKQQDAPPLSNKPSTRWQG